MFSDSRGDVAPGSTGGLVHEDTRFVSRWELRLDGEPLSLLKSGPVDYDSAAFFLTNPDTSRLRAHSVAVRRLRHVGSGALEQLTVFNTSSEPVTCEPTSTVSTGCNVPVAWTVSTTLFHAMTTLAPWSSNW